MRSINNVKTTLFFMTKQSVILITGASSGFGKTTATALVKQGHIVYGTSRKKVESTNGCRMLTLDVTNPESIQKAIQQIIKEEGHIDVLINNAGMGISGALELATDKEIALQMNTNFFGVANMCKAVLPYMRKARTGKIINISSIGGVIAVPFQGFYSASKFAVEGFSEALALEVHPFNIDVCLVEPGDFQTNFTANRNISALTLDNPDYREIFQRTMEIIEHEENNGAKPQRLADAICKLVNKRHPAFRTKVGPAEQVFLAKIQSFIPNRLLQFILRTFYKIPNESNMTR